MNMLEIIQTPNVEANKMLFDQDDLEEEEAEGEEVNGEDEEESDWLSHSQIKIKLFIYNNP